MTIANFKARVYGFINRSSALFTTSEGASIDQVLYAMNDARRVAQRSHQFELNRADVFLTTSEVGADWMTGCKTTPGGATAVLMRQVDSVWNYSTNSVSAGTVYARTSKIDYGKVGDFDRELPVDSGSIQIQTAVQSQLARRKFAFCKGSTLHVVSVDTATPVLLNGIKFLDDLTGSETPDIFLTYFTDWFFWATLIQLNQFLKDSERIQIDYSFVNSLWETVKTFDGQIANSGDNASLD